MPQLLLELFSEDIPARMQPGAARDLARLATERFGAAGLAVSELRAFAGPRRLTLVADGLPRAQADRTEERKGPRLGAPDAAVDGFARSAGVARQALVARDGAWFAVIARQGRLTASILAEVIPTIVTNFPWPRSMTWGSGALRWVRPLRRILCVFDGKVTPFEIDGLGSGDLAEGHRFMGAPGPFAVRGFDDYAQGLADRFVVLEEAERARRILEGARALCAARGLELVEDEGLLREVCGMAEWPVPLLGAMDPAFLELPPEVVRTTMRQHQRYFAVRRADGALAPHFVAVANIETPDDGALIAAGNARVLSARLQDARFFWAEDRRLALADRLDRLAGVTFHAKLGSMAERVERIEALAARLAPALAADPDKVALAARLAKADLVTAMVGEFPELQGTMGAYYALAEGLDGEIAAAIGDHYKPQGPADRLPAGPIGAAVALADKLDTLVGFFEIGEKPTGSRDPFALRRTALGAIRIILDRRVALSLRAVIAYAGAGQAVSVIRNVTETRLNSMSYKQAVAAFPDPAVEFGAADELEAVFKRLQTQPFESALEFWSSLNDTAWIEEVLDFMLERLKGLLRDEGLRHDVCDAVLALGGDDLIRVAASVRSLEAFVATPDGADLLTGYRRAVNLLSAEARKGPMPQGAILPRPGRPVAEAGLIDALAKVEPRLEAALAAEDFAAALEALAALRAPVDAFFEQLLVNSPIAEERDDRLRLLDQVRAAMGRVADFSLISG